MKMRSRNKIKRMLWCLLGATALCMVLFGCGRISAEGETRNEAGSETVTGETPDNEAVAGKNPEDEGTQLEVHFIDVGQGDAALVICGGEAMMIDGGPQAMSDRIYAYLKSQGIDHLKYVVASHPDEDHIGGLAGALNYADCERAYCSVSEYEGSRAFDSLKKYLGSVKLEVPEAGTEIWLGPARVEFLGPASDGGSDNNNSLIFKIEFAGTSVLFTGDAESVEERALIESGADIRCDVLKVAHHGSSTSTCPEFLEAADPDIAVISCGAANDYFHPNDQVLADLKKTGVTLFRTDMQGTVIIRSDGSEITAETGKTPDADIFSTYSELYPVRSVPAADEGEDDEDEHLYILNTSSHLVHVPTCESVSKMSEKNRLEVTGALADILGEYEGYRVCERCRARY